jgi:hypothetical protein
MPVEHNIGGLQIAVQHAVFMGGRQSCRKLAGNVQRLFIRKMPNALQQRCQVFPVNELHRQKVPSFNLTDVINPADVRVRQLPCNPHLCKEAFPAHGVAGKLWR